MSDENPVKTAGAVTAASLLVAGIAVALSGGVLAVPLLGGAVIAGGAAVVANNKKK